MKTTIKNDQASLSVVLCEQKQSLKKSHNESIAVSIAKKSNALDKAKRARSKEIEQLNKNVCGTRKKLKAIIDEYREAKDQLKHEKKGSCKTSKQIQ